MGKTKKLNAQLESGEITPKEWKTKCNEARENFWKSQRCKCRGGWRKCNHKEK